LQISIHFGGNALSYLMLQIQGLLTFNLKAALSQDHAHEQ
jgi:hypothetical protein